MRRHCRKVGLHAPPDDGVVHPAAADSQDKISGRHVHVLNDLIWAPPNHTADARHAAHPGTEFQIAFLFNVNAPLFIQAVFFPDGGVFNRVVIMQGKPLPWFQGQHQQRLAAFYRHHLQLQAAGQKHYSRKQCRNQAGCH